MINLNWFQLVLVLALATVLTHAAPKQNPKHVPGFTYLGSRSSYSNDTKEFIESNYYASATSGIWTQASADCVEMFGEDSDLVSIETEYEQLDINLWLHELGTGGSIFWTSGMYEIFEGEWRWSGNPGYNLGTYTNWYMSTAPVNPNGRQRIGLNHEDRFSADWQSFDDTRVARYICELKSAENVETRDPFPVPCNVPVDIAFVVDSSLSVGEANFDNLRRFTALVASAFSVHSSSRISVYTYASSAEQVISMNNTLNPIQIEQEILNMPYLSGTTSTHLGISQATAELMTNPRFVPQIYFVITDGVSDQPIETKLAAEAATAGGILTFSMGIADLIYYDELVVIAGNNSANVFISEWEDMFNIVSEVTTQLCP